MNDFHLIEEFPIKNRLKRKRPAALALELNLEEPAALFACGALGHPHTLRVVQQALET